METKMNIAQTVEKKLGEYGVPEMRCEIDERVAAVQSENAANLVSFGAALAAALDDLLTGGDYPDSLRALVTEIPVDCGLPENPAPEQITEKLREFLNDERTLLTLVTPEFEFPPENGEPLDANWIFCLRCRPFWDGLHWIVVDRAGEKETYNYGFN